MPQTFPLTAVIAHRGASAFAPENTLAAFQAAVDAGADGIELDVQLSADGEVVVIHDDELSRTTNGNGLVSEKKLAELKELDAGGWFGQEFLGQQIPTLAEVFDLVGGRLIINIELKGPVLFGSALPEKVVSIVNQFPPTNQIIFSSFNPWLLRQLRNLLPEARLGQLLRPGRLAGVTRILRKMVVAPWSYHPHFRTITDDFFCRAERQGRPVLAYTVNDPTEVKRLCTLGIYGIITDDPAAALAVRAELN